MCGVCACAARQLVLIFVASRQKHAPLGIKLILFLCLTLSIDQSEQEQGELLRPHIETSKLADLNEDNNLKLVQPQTVRLLLLAFSSLFSITASIPAAKHHQIIVLIGELAG